MPRSNAIRGTMVLLYPNAQTNQPYLNSTLFAFQYNPENLTHTFSPIQEGPAVSATTPGPVAETFSLTFDLESDDIDPHEQTETTTNYGLHSTLAVLESMMQPYAADGRLQLPMVVFNWGSHRIVAVQFLSMKIEETAFDGTLNPTKVTVSICMRVLEPSELKTTSAAYAIAVGHTNLRATLVSLYKREHQQFDQSGAEAAASAGGVSSSGAQALASAAGFSESASQQPKAANKGAAKAKPAPKTAVKQKRFA